MISTHTHTLLVNYTNACDFRCIVEPTTIRASLAEPACLSSQPPLRASLVQPARPSSYMAHHKVNAVIAFLKAAHPTMGGTDAWAGIVKSQVNAIVDFVGASPPTIEDASLALSALSEQSASVVFPEADRSAIAIAITTAASSTASSSAPIAATSHMRPGSQSHFFMYNYMTEEDWNLLLMQSSPGIKMKVIVDRGLSIGLVYPSEKTIVSIVAIVILVSNTVLSSSEAYNLLDQLKRAWKTHRRSVQFEQTCAQFPPAVADFQQSYPGRYSVDAPPVISRLSIALIEDLRSTLAARKTHRSLSVSAHQGIGHQQLPSLVMLTPSRSANAQQPKLGMTLSPLACDADHRAPLPLTDCARQGSSASLGSASHVDERNISEVSTRVTTPKLLDVASMSSTETGICAEDNDPHNVQSSALVAVAPAIVKQDVDKPTVVGDLDDVINTFRSAAVKNAALKKDASGLPPKASSKAKAKATAKASSSIASTSQSATDKGKRACVDRPEAQPPTRRVRTKMPGVQSPVVSGKASQHIAENDPMKTPSKSSKSEGCPKAAMPDSGTKTFSKPFITREWSRKQVLARTGRRGAGNSKAFKFDGEDSSQAVSDAIEWLQLRCGELGIEWKSASG